jgi:TIR domain
MPSIFISHSTEKGESAAAVFLEQIRDGLSRHYDVFLDLNSIQGGEDWLTKITNHLVYCDAAVLVLSRRALASEFVQFEVSNLLARRKRDLDPQTHQPLFTFIPVIPLYPGEETKKDDISKSMHAELANGFWQKTFFTTQVQVLGPLSAAEALNELLARFNTLGSEVPTTPLAELQMNVASYLESADNKWLQSAAAAAGFPPPPPGLDRKAAALYTAKQLLLCSMINLQKALNKLKAILRQDLTEVFELLAPCWVSLVAAQGLTPLLKRALSWQPPGSWVVVNGSYPLFTPKMFIRRALGGWKSDAERIIHLPLALCAAHTQEEIRLGLLNEFQKLLMIDVPATDPQFLDELTETLEIVGQMQPIVVALHLPDVSDLAFLMNLSQSDPFKRVVFFALAGSAPAPSGPDFLLLTPELNAGQEKKAHISYNQIKAIFAA